MKVGFEEHLESINKAYKTYFYNDKEIEFILLKKPRWSDNNKLKLLKMLYFLLKSFFDFSVGKYDLVHINGSRIGFIAYLASFFKCKYIYTIHGCPHREFEKKEGVKKNILSYISEFFMPIVAKRAKRVLTISNFSKYELWDKYKIEADVIYNGFNKFPINNINIDIENNKVIFISVGRMIEYKNPCKVIDVFKEAKKQIPNAYLILIGDGILEKDVKKYIKLNNLEKDVLLKKKISFQEMGAWYRKSKYFISACETEGFGLAALEAVACGCIPILPNSGAFPEIFLDKKYLYNVNNIAKFRFIDLLDNDKKFLNNIVKKYSWKNSIEQYKKFYISLCSMK